MGILREPSFVFAIDIVWSHDVQMDDSLSET